MNKAKNQTHKDLICGEFSTSHSTPQMCGEWPLHFDPKMADQVKCACSTRVHIIKGLATECKPALAVWLTEENSWVLEAELSEETTWFFPWGNPTQELLSSRGTLWRARGGWSGWNTSLSLWKRREEAQGRSPGAWPPQSVWPSAWPATGLPSQRPCRNKPGVLVSSGCCDQLPKPG